MEEDKTERERGFYLHPEVFNQPEEKGVESVRSNHAATLLADGRVLVSGGNGPLAGAELFDSSTALPQITGVSISGKKLLVQGNNFDDGAKLLLNDEKQKTVNDELTPTTLLLCKKAERFIGSGETVRLKVRNSDGTESAEFSYTRPAQ